MVSRQITSEAKALPPGEFILRTIALTCLSSLARFMAAEVLTDPILFSSPSP